MIDGLYKVAEFLLALLAILFLSSLLGVLVLEIIDRGLWR